MTTAIEQEFAELDSKLARADAEAAQRHLRDFVREAWPVVEPARPFISGWHSDAICDHLEAVTLRQIQYLLINVPPGHAKSLIVAVLWPAWVWAQSVDHISGGPRWRGMFSSYSQDLSVRDSVKCRALMESQWYREAGFRGWNFSTDQNVKSYFQNSEMGFRMALSVGGQGTGFRGDAIVCDDAMNAKDQYSDTVRRSVTFWWDHVMSSRLNDLSVGSKVIIQQRLHAKDLAGHVLEIGGYEHLNLPSEFEPERRSKTFIMTVPSAADGGGRKPFFEDPRKAPGELLFPALFPPKVIAAAKRDLGSTGYAGQHQQRPSAEEGGIVKRHWWRYWKPVGSAFGAVSVRQPDGSFVDIQPVEIDPTKMEETLQSWDCAFKDKSDSDFVVGLVLGKRDANRYVLDCNRGRMDLPKTMQAVKDTTERWPKAYRKLVEDKANGPAVVQMLKGQITGLVEVDPEGGKISRAAAVSPEVESGNWYLPHPHLYQWVSAFIDECADFPNGANDDQVDAWSQGGIKFQTSGMGLLGVWRQQAEEIKAAHVGQAVVADSASLADAQKKGSDTWVDNLAKLSGNSMAKVAITSRPPQENCCPSCGNRFVQMFSEAFKCSCGTSGPLSALKASPN